MSFQKAFLLPQCGAKLGQGKEVAKRKILSHLGIVCIDHLDSVEVSFELQQCLTVR
jgi:hypothetical protein